MLTSFLIYQLIGTINDPLSGTPLAGGASEATRLLGAILRLVTIAAGIYALINFVLAGISYISSTGNPEKTSRAWAQIYQSLIGLIIVVLSFVLAALLGLLLFGNATALLDPTITGP